MMLHTKYDGSMSSDFRQDFFHVFPIVSCDLGTGPFLNPGALFEETW